MGSGYFDLEKGKAQKIAMNDPKWLDDPVAFHVPGCCVAIQNKSHELDWRNSVVLGDT